MIGEKIGKWLVIERVYNGKHGTYYDCRCDCGDIYQIRGDILKNKRSKQCKNCRQKEIDIVENSIIGKKIGKWTVGKRINFDGQSKLFECQCDCGRIHSVQGSRLFKGKANGCKDCLNLIHGMDKTPTKYTWRTMIARCTNQKNHNYKYYGAKGVTVCERWGTFKNFLDDMGVKPEGLQLDRIDPYGNYEPSNCRWVTSKENNNNKRKHKIK